MPADKEQVDISNRGVYSLHVRRGPAVETERTYVVLGAARGGTSMVASCLQSLGIFIGDRLTVGNLEDHELRDLWRKGETENIEKLIDRRNREHPVWGVKFPAMVRTLDRVGLSFRNPYYLLIMRDPIAVAGRKIAARVGGEERVMEMAMAAQNAYLASLNFLQKQARPTLLISYEKALANPRTFCEAVAEFVAKADPALVDRAVADLKANHSTYLDRVSNSVAKYEKLSRRKPGIRRRRLAHP
jgi:hypothetical protein